MTDCTPTPESMGPSAPEASAAERSLEFGSPEETELHRAMLEDGRRYLLYAAVTGLSCALLFCDAKTGINVPVFSLIWLVCMFLSLKRLGLWKRKESLSLCAGILLLSLSCAMTVNTFVHDVNRLGIALLMAMLVLRAFCETAGWQFGKYFTSLFRLVFTALGKLPDPVRCLRFPRKECGSGKAKYILLGLVISVPLVFVVLALLLSADLMFNKLFSGIFSFDLDITGLPRTLLKGLGYFLLCFFGFFCILSGQAGKPVPSETTPGKQREPLVAVTFTSVLAVIYVAFCLVQIIYLFIGRQSALPEGYTYAEYARRGFFQLLFVSMINAVLVMFCSWKFSSSRALRLLLTLISGCTYILIASSAYRMLLYVDAYGLTFLRIIVLWFLGVLAILMAGIIVSVYRRSFDLFRFALAVCLVLWLSFSFARPDRIAAQYNVSRFGVTDDIACQMIYELSMDAVPVMAQYNYNGMFSQEWDGYLQHSVSRAYTEHGVRGFNLALLQAERAAENAAGN